MSGSNHKKYDISVTIITLTYQDFTEIGNTIRSVFSQNFSSVKSVEYIIADDGSYNYKKEFIISEINKFNNPELKLESVIIYSNDENVGTVKSFNKAIGLSSGDIVIPLSAGDEFYDADAVSLITAAFNNNKAPILTAYREISNGRNALAVRPTRRYANLIKSGKNDRLLKLLAVRGNFISGACTYYRREFLKRIGGFDESYTLLEDYPLYVKALNEGYSIGFIDRVTMKHQVGGVSNSRHKKIHPSLKNDFNESKKWIKRNILLTARERRMFDFFQLKNKKQKLKPKTVFMNIDCFVIWIGLALYDKFLDMIYK